MNSEEDNGVAKKKILVCVDPFQLGSIIDAKGFDVGHNYKKNW